MKIRFIVVFLFLFCRYSWATVGFAESVFITPGKHTICACDNVIDANQPSIIGFENEIPRISTFYFYKNNIIGETDSLFFIFNESNEQLKVFSNEEKWTQTIKQSNLKPFLTRWLNMNDSPDDIFLAIILSSVVTLPLSLLYLFFLFRCLIKSIKQFITDLYHFASDALKIS